MPGRRGSPRRRSCSTDGATALIDGNAVRSVDRAASLLLALGESAGEAGVTELARRLGLHKSTASRASKTGAATALRPSSNSPIAVAYPRRRTRESSSRSGSSSVSVRSV
jgi:hypothetical protein